MLTTPTSNPSSTTSASPPRAMAGCDVGEGPGCLDHGHHVGGEGDAGQVTRVLAAGGTRPRSVEADHAGRVAGGVAERECPVSGVDGDGAHEVVRRSAAGDRRRGRRAWPRGPGSVPAGRGSGRRRLRRWTAEIRNQPSSASHSPLKFLVNRHLRDAERGRARLPRPCPARAADTRPGCGRRAGATAAPAAPGRRRAGRPAAG